MPALPRNEPFHEPIGMSPEGERLSRAWLVTLVLTVAALAAGLAMLFVLRA